MRDRVFDSALTVLYRGKESDICIEGLYQAFKERLMAEVVAEKEGKVFSENYYGHRVMGPSERFNLVDKDPS